MFFSLLVPDVEPRVLYVAGKCLPPLHPQPRTAQTELYTPSPFLPKLPRVSSNLRFSCLGLLGCWGGSCAPPEPVHTLRLILTCVCRVHTYPMG